MESESNGSDDHHERESNKQPTGSRNKRSVSYNSNVELLVVVDESMMTYYHDQDVETYVLTIMNIVSIVYKK